jgi:hypothetical protein
MVDRARFIRLLRRVGDDRVIAALLGSTDYLAKIA